MLQLYSKQFSFRSQQIREVVYLSGDHSILCCTVVFSVFFQMASFRSPLVCSQFPPPSERFALVKLLACSLAIFFDRVKVTL